MNGLSRTVLLAIIFVLLFGKIFSEQRTQSILLSSQYKIDTWGIDEGLPQNSVRAIVQTRDGFLWLGTYGGLARFDGVKFNVYNRSNTAAMLSDRILCLREDAQGTLWIGTENGGVMTFRDGVFSVFTKKDGLADNAVSTIVEDSNGRMWFSHDRNIISKYENRTFTTFSFQDSASANYFIAISPNGNLLYVTSQKMFSFENGTFHTYQSPFIHADLNISHSPVWDARGNCWITTSRGLYKFPSGDMRKPYMQEGVFTSKYFYSMLVDSKNNLWVTTEKDFCRFDSVTFTSFSNADNISRNRIITLYEDREENLWLGTHTGGLIRLRKIPFTVFTVNEPGVVNNITSITSLKNGAVVYGLNCGGFGVIINDKVNAVHALRDEINNCVWSLFENYDGQFWMGTWGGGLYQCRLNERSEPVFIAKETRIASATVLAIYEDRKKTMWFGTYDDGLFQLQNDSVTHYSTANGLCDNDVRTILEDRRGNLWFGTSNGLSKFSENKFTTFTTSNGLSINSIRTLYEDANSVLWIGTYGGGLNKYENGKFFSVTTDEGLFDNLVSHILEDENGYFWMGCNRGIFRVAKKELNDVVLGKRTTVSSVSFGKDHGLFNVETNGGFQPNALKTSDGRLWFPTVDGVACINPSDVKLNTTIIPVVIEKIYVDQKEIPFSDSLSAGPEQHSIIITYTAPSFIEAKKVKFKYKLIGYDEQWIDAETRREAYYTELPGGDYKFIVIAANSDGIWNNIGASVSFTIIPQFWKTKWFIFLISGSFICIAFFLFRSRNKHFQRAKLEQELFSRRLLESHEEERKRIASELHDSIGQDLLVIKNRVYLAMDTESDPQQSRKQMEIISSTASKTLKELREIAHNLRPYELDRLGLTEALNEMIATIQDTSAIRFISEIDELADIFNSEEETHIFRIVQEILNNILKHSEAKEVFIMMKKRETIVTIAVRDNGKGFDYQRTMQQKANILGIGISGLQERVRLFKGTFELESSPDNGTHIHISLPTQHNK